MEPRNPAPDLEQVLKGRDDFARVRPDVRLALGECLIKRGKGLQRMLVNLMLALKYHRIPSMPWMHVLSLPWERNG